MRLRFPRIARLTRSSEFARVRAEGKSFHGKFMVLGVFRHQEATDTRLGVITSRKVGGAVDRSRARRRFREVIRVDRPSLTPNFWIVVIAKKPAVTIPFADLQREWRSLAKRAGVLVLEP